MIARVFITRRSSFEPGLQRPIALPKKAATTHTRSRKNDNGMPWCLRGVHCALPIACAHAHQRLLTAPASISGAMRRASLLLTSNIPPLANPCAAGHPHVVAKKIDVDNSNFSLALEYVARLKPMACHALDRCENASVFFVLHIDDSDVFTPQPIAFSRYIFARNSAKLMLTLLGNSIQR
jgi:hypothetical protein